MYNYYLTETSHLIDVIICPEPKQKLSTTEYRCIEDTLKQKLKKKIYKDRYSEVIRQLDSVLESGGKCIIQLIDNHGLVEPVTNLIEEKGYRKNCYIQFFYHGFSPFYGNFKSRRFFESIDEHVLPTMDSYLEHKRYYSILPCRFSVQHNGIDRSRFTTLSENEKQELRQSMELKDEKVFLWCSQDKPKKGLDFLLPIWKQFHKEHKDTVLWVIGATRDLDVEGVKFFGKVPNDEIHTYYQASDVYLFPTLCQEGFGLSLVEALSCGNLCIASANGGIPEVLNYGEYGILVNHPNFAQEWLQHMRESMNTNVDHKFVLPEEKYTIASWSKNMNDKIEQAKLTLI